MNRLGALSRARSVVRGVNMTGSILSASCSTTSNSDNGEYVDENSTNSVTETGSSNGENAQEECHKTLIEEANQQVGENPLNAFLESTVDNSFDESIEEHEEYVAETFVAETSRDEEQGDKDFESNKNPLNTSLDPTLDCSFDEFCNQEDEGKKGDDNGMVCGFPQRSFYYGLAILHVFFLITTVSVPALTLTSAAMVVTEAPTQSIAPSASPTNTLTPSFEPTSSLVPSIQPSNNPTKTFRPTQVPSEEPTLSLVPSIAPTTSMIPSLVPSLAPTASKQPSPEPSVSPSMEPTFSPIDPQWSFKLRLYWQRGYFWQEERFETFWCMACVRCSEYGRGDGWEHGCRSYGSSDNSQCREGDSLWIRDCRYNGNKFNVIQKERSGYQLRLHNRNLCIDRKNNILRLKKCDINDDDQLFVPWHDFTKFELRPLVMEDQSERKASCVSQLHHPKDEELVGMHNCRLSRIYQTRHWEKY